MKLYRDVLLLIFILSMSLGFLAACGAEATDSTSQGESAPSESGSVTESSVTSTTPAPIDTVSIVPLSAAVIYSVNTDGVLLYADATRSTVLRTLAKGEQVTVTAASGRYALTSDGGYVNLMLLTAVGPVVVEPLPTDTQAIEPTETAAANTPTPTPKPKTATPTPRPATTTTTTAAATTAAPTETWYTENCENIRNLVIAKLQERGLWYPDAKVIGWDWKAWTLGYTCSDEKYAESYVQGKFGETKSIGVTSVTVAIWVNPDDGLTYLRIDTTKCALPTPTPAA